MATYDRKAGKPYKTYAEISDVGRSQVEIMCPHCDALFWAYIWSLAGSGKKCPGCGAKHVWMRRMAYPVVKVKNNG